MVKLNYVLIKANHIAQIFYSLSHTKSNQLSVICPGQKNKQFFKLLNTNTSYKNIRLLTINQYVNQNTQENSTVVLTIPPNTFENLNQILQKAESQKNIVILALLQQNKKYLNIISKKIQNLELSQMVYSHNKFVGINDKIRDFVDKSYDMNRAAFYAYGEYINSIRANPLKKIFRTQILNLDQLARSYGFTSAQRVKQGNFLKASAQKLEKARKKAEKRKNKKQKMTLNNNQNVQDENQIQIPEPQIIQKPKKKVLKKKTIKKQKQMKIRSIIEQI